MERNAGIDWEAVDDVIYGCANQAGEDNRNVARMALLLAGLPQVVPGSTVNRLCGSGMDALTICARAIKAGEAELMIAGGVESMSRAPFVMPKADTAFSRNAEIYDTTIGWRFVNPVMKKQYGVDSMPETGENVAEQFGVSRADQDAFAVHSQEKAVAAQGNGRLAKEIVPVTIPQRKGDPVVVDKDEHPRAGTTVEALAKLGTPFKKEGGTVTAGNASGVNDGAAALIVASEAAIRKYRLTPIARVLGVRDGRCGAPHHGHRSCAGDQETVCPPRHQAVRFRPDRTERSLRLPRHSRAARPRYPRGRAARKPEWRGDRAGPSARHVGRAHIGYGCARARGARRETGAGNDVHRCRAGHCRSSGKSLINKQFSS
jgi:hypothetical protein